MATNIQNCPLCGRHLHILESQIGKRVVCPKCEGVMREGFVPDYTKEEFLATQLRPGVWVAGRPQSSFWTGTWTGEERYPVRAFRCDECGYLEFYARD